MNNVTEHLNYFLAKHEEIVKAYKNLLKMAQPWIDKYGTFNPDGCYDGFDMGARDFSTNDIKPGIFVSVWRFNERRDYAFQMKAAVLWTDDKKFEYTIKFNRKRPKMPAVLQYKNNDELIAAFEEFLEEDRKKILQTEKQKIATILNSLPG